MLLAALLSLFPFLSVQDNKADLSKTKLFVYDSEKGMTLRVKDDGKVELTVKEEKADKTYSADSAQEFEKKYPEIVKKNGIQKYLRPQGGATQEDFEKWWAERLRQLPKMPELKPFDEEFKKLIEEQRKRMDEFGKEFQKRFSDPNPGVPPPPVPAPAPAPAGREFGVKIDSVGETLRDQLSLKEGEGVLVGEVKPGSVAEKSGLKQHDIILKLDGGVVGDKWGFRKDVLKALEKPEFELEILRGGKKETLKAKTGVKKED
jgi:C-terminal processing protease CtpA/Prc